MTYIHIFADLPPSRKTMRQPHPLHHTPHNIHKASNQSVHTHSAAIMNS